MPGEPCFSFSKCSSFLHRACVCVSEPEGIYTKHPGFGDKFTLNEESLMNFLLSHARWLQGELTASSVEGSQRPGKDKVLRGLLGPQLGGGPFFFFRIQKQLWFGSLSTPGPCLLLTCCGTRSKPQCAAARCVITHPYKDGCEIQGRQGV